ncbi:MAG: Delta-aminolevulinic acid dehydratase [Deltaproteobacteria bacterium ADurb.Bin510]|nr:MAG: Delta-aminolevulinic acid dehydratase [Deltaproteobacteria bacterium ADurb.Bin510]
MFPENRPRRLRRTANLRALVRETQLNLNDLIQPLFIKEGARSEEPIASLPGQSYYAPDNLKSVVRRIEAAGLKGVLLFGLPKHKDAYGSAAHNKNGAVQEATRRIKDLAPELVVITDVCLCGYTDHGHCGLIGANGQVENDETAEILAKVALSHAKAGSDMLAPSDMMDGRVGVIREALDEAGFEHLPIMSYAAKYASCFYGPFRDAAGCAPAFGDRRTYQMDPANAREAVREAQLDVEEGADILMVKPAGPCLDIIRSLADEFNEPLCAYQVSGEYAMIKAASERGWLDEQAAVLESLTAIKRAGADLIISYFALQAAGLLK